MGRMGGLQDYRADARGVFVFRYAPLSELPPEKQSKWAEKGYGDRAEIPVVYRLNLADANSMFCNIVYYTKGSKLGARILIPVLKEGLGRNSCDS